jgi:hypothetical protein
MLGWIMPRSQPLIPSLIQSSTIFEHQMLHSTTALGVEEMSKSLNVVLGAYRLDGHNAAASS